jgi:DNA-binding NarL/FixJ family response regulator
VTGDLDSLLQDRDIRHLILDMRNESFWHELILMVRRTRPEIRLIVLGAGGRDEMVLRSILEGARAYLDQSAGPLEIRQAVDGVVQGEIWAPRRLLSAAIDHLLAQPAASASAGPPELSRRERQVLELIMKAYSNREIAQELAIEERTVKSYVASLMRKSGVDNRVALSVHATQDSIGNKADQQD